MRIRSLDRQFVSFVYAALALSLALFGTSLLVPRPAAAAPAGRLAPSFTLQGSTGEPVSLSDYRGRVVLLDFWATWCHGCKTEIPWFMEFANKYRDQGLAVIGAAMDDNGWKYVRPYMAEKKMNYVVVVGDTNLAKSYDLGPMPMTLLIDRDGRIAARHVGVVDKVSFEAELRSLLRDSKRGSF